MRTLTFKVSDEEARKIRRAARRQKLTLSEFLRRRVGAPASAKPLFRRVRCRHTGAVIFSAGPGEAPLTTDAVRDILADFP